MAAWTQAKANPFPPAVWKISLGHTQPEPLWDMAPGHPQLLPGGQAGGSRGGGETGQVPFTDLTTELTDTHTKAL